MRPLKWTELRDFCESEGCVFDRQRGDHYIMTREGVARPVVTPMKRDLKEDVVLSVARTLGLNRKQIIARLEARKRASRGK